MIDCKELIGKIVRQVTIFENSDYGPEINIEFTDDSNFNVCLKNAIEAKLTLDEGESYLCHAYCLCGSEEVPTVRPTISRKLRLYRRASSLPRS